MEDINFYIGNIDSAENIKQQPGETKIHHATCVPFFANSEKVALETAKILGLDSFGKVVNIKLKGKDY